MQPPQLPAYPPNSHAQEGHVSDDEDALNEIIMALSMTNNGNVGCAYYVALDEALYLQQDVPMAGLDLVETLLLHVQPTTVIVPSRMPDNIMEYLEKGAQQLGHHQHGKSGEPLIEDEADLI